MKPNQEKLIGRLDYLKPAGELFLFPEAYVEKDGVAYQDNAQGLSPSQKYQLSWGV